MKYIIILLAFLVPPVLYSQPSSLWAKQLGGAYNDMSRHLATDNSGNVYTVGQFMDTADFNPGSGVYNFISAGWNDIYITKLDASGNFIWAKSIGGIWDDIPLSLELDAFDNVYVTGSFSDAVDFDPGSGTQLLTANGMYDAFVLKLNSAGNFVWSKQMEGTNQSSGSDITFDVKHNTYIIGTFSGVVDFDPGPSIFNLTGNVNYESVFILKLDSNGDFVFAKQFSEGVIDVNSINIDAFGNIYTAGGFQGVVDFDPGTAVYNLTSLGTNGMDIFISKLDSLGDFVWAKRMGASSHDDSFCTKIDNSGNIYSTGSFVSTVDFDPNAGIFNLTSNSFSADIFISKLNKDGNFVWAKQIGGADTDIGTSIFLKTDNDLYIGGIFTDIVDFDPGVATHSMTSNGGNDIFILKVDSIGNFMWSKQIGGGLDDVCRTITVDAANNIYSDGYFSDMCDFNPATPSYILSSFGQTDAYVCKFTENTVGIEEYTESKKTDVYPNPVTDVLTMHLPMSTTEQTTIQIINSLGQIIYEKPMPTENLNLNTHDLSPGLYYLRVNQNSIVFISKFIKE